MESWSDNILLLSDSYKVSHWRQYPPGTSYVYSYFESRGCDREGWNEVCFFGLQYFLKRYLVGQVVTRAKIEQAAKIYAEHFGDGVNENPDLFYREGWEYILDKHGGKLPIKIKAVPEGMVVPNKSVLITVVNTDPECFWLTNFLESLLVQVWFPMTVCSNSRYQKLSIQKYLEETGCEDWAPPGGSAFKLHDFGFRGVSSVESAALGGLGHLVNFLGSDTVIALIAAQEFYGAKKAVGTSIPASEHSTITSWGPEHEKDAMRNMLEQYKEGLVACVSDSFDVFRACREYWGDALKDMIKGRISDSTFGQLIVRPDSGDPEETCVAIMKILLEQFKEDVTETRTGHKLLPPYIRIIQGDGVDYQSIPKILQRFKDEGFAAANIVFGSGGALLQKVNRDTFKVAFKCSEVTLDSGEEREVFKDPITDDGKASKKGKLTLQHASDFSSYAQEDIYLPRQGPDGVRGGTGFLHFSPDGKYVTVASGRGDPDRDILVDVYENGDLLKDYTFAEIRRRADVVNGPFSFLPEEDEEEVAPAADGSGTVDSMPASAPSQMAVGYPGGYVPQAMPSPQPVMSQAGACVSRPSNSPVPVNSSVVMVHSPAGVARPVHRGPSFVAAPPQVQRPSFVAAPPVVSGQPRNPSFVAAPPGASQASQSASAPMHPAPAYYPQGQPAMVAMAGQGGRPSFVAAPPAPMTSRASGLVAAPAPGQSSAVCPPQAAPCRYQGTMPAMYHQPQSLQGTLRSGILPQMVPMQPSQPMQPMQAMPQRSASTGVGFGLGSVQRFVR